MLSQPATKIFLKTTEPNAAEWVSTKPSAGSKLNSDARNPLRIGSRAFAATSRSTARLEALVLDSGDQRFREFSGAFLGGQNREIS